MWIEPALKPRAETMNYTVVDATSVLATHLTELVKSHADELLTREEVNHLLEQLKKTSPKLVEETVPSVVKTGELQKVLQNLLRERVPIRDLETILETLGDWAVHTKDLDVLTEYVRNALRRTICATYVESGEDGRARLYCVTMDPAVEDLVNGYVERGPTGTTLSIPPPVAKRIAERGEPGREPLLTAGHQLVVLTSPSVRATAQADSRRAALGCRRAVVQRDRAGASTSNRWVWYNSRTSRRRCRPSRRRWRGAASDESNRDDPADRLIRMIRLVRMIMTSE